MADKQITFEQQLQKDLKQIFQAKKVTFEQPSDVKEQESLFVELEQPHTSFKDKSIRIRVSGKCTMFGNSEKLTVGYFAKCIAKAPVELHKKFHFSEIDANTKYFGNLVQRDFSFVYFFSDQYDPDTGSMTSIELDITEV